MGTQISYPLSCDCRQKSCAYGGNGKAQGDRVQKGPGTKGAGLKCPSPTSSGVRQARGARLPLLLEHSAKLIRRFDVALSMRQTKRALTMMPALEKVDGALRTVTNRGGGVGDAGVNDGGMRFVS